jgi:AbrB family looped-hinge helix DNA binding protein
MSTVQLRYDGWVTLPAAALKKFGLSTGDRLEVELTNNAIVLRRAQKASASDPDFPDGLMFGWCRMPNLTAWSAC